MQDFPDVELLRPYRMTWHGPVALWGVTVLLVGYFAVPGAPPEGNVLVSGLFLACAGGLQYLMLRGRDVVLSVEGVRKGTGPRSTFIRWQGATLRYIRKGRYFVVTANGARIEIRDTHFDQYRFWEIMHYLRYVAYAQSLTRNARAAKIGTPLHGLTEKDRQAFLRYRGDGFFRQVFWPYLSWPVFAVCLAYVGVVEAIIRWPARVAAVPAFKAVWHAFPVLFYRGNVLFLVFVLFLAGFFIAARGLPMLLGLRQRRTVRSGWLQQFGRAQVVSISEVGLLHKDAARESFHAWNDIGGISDAGGLILFHLVPELPLSVIVPKRVFAAPAEATDFYRKALEFKRAALTAPNLVEPVSFWEIA
jgi:hypothetical protein